MDNLGSHLQLQLHSLPREGLDLAGAVKKNKDLAFQLFLPAWSMLASLIGKRVVYPADGISLNAEGDGCPKGW